MGKRANLCVSGGMLDVRINMGLEFDEGLGINKTIYTEPEAIEALNLDALVEWIEENDITDVTFLSSCDWPEDGGLPANTDIRGWVDEAFYVVEERQKVIARKKLRNDIGEILDKHFKTHPQMIEVVVDDLMELTVL